MCLLGGGASAIQQYLAAGLIDGFELHIVPVLLGEGERLLENVGSLRVEQVRAIEAPGVTHISTASSDRRTCRTEAVSAGSAARGR